MVVRLLRHTEGLHNIDLWTGGPKTNPIIPLTLRGHEHAREIGAELNEKFPGFLERAFLFESPFRRTRETMDGMLAGAGLVTPDGKYLVRRYVDDRLGELDFGGEELTRRNLRSKPGGLWEHRFPSGQSLAINGYNTAVHFINELIDMMVAATCWDALIVSHGWTILTLVVAWFGCSGEDFNRMKNVLNGNYVTIAPVRELTEPAVFRAKDPRLPEEYGITGIYFR